MTTRQDETKTPRLTTETNTPAMAPTPYQTRRNRGQARLLACTRCVECRATIFPDAVTRYRVRPVPTGFMAAPAFDYAHGVGDCAAPEETHA